MVIGTIIGREKNTSSLIYDEFQNVGVISQGSGIEAAIRHVAQKTTHLTFVFSGSNRHLLKTMFEDETRPLYKLCWKLPLQRISREHYEKHLQKAAVLAWHQALSPDLIQKILLLSEQHPFYLNKLCDRLWTYHPDIPPSAKEVNSTWLEILEEEKSDAVKELSSLPSGQKKVLAYLAKISGSQLTNAKAIFAMGMPPSSISTVLASLEAKDLIEKTEGNYRIVSPVLKFYIIKSPTAGSAAIK